MGADAQAGVISVITRSGRGLAKPEVTARAEIGTRNSGGGSASVRGAVGPVYGAFSFSNDSTRGFNTSRFGSETDGDHATVVSGKAGIDFNEYFNLEGSVRWMDRWTRIDNSDYAATYPPPFFMPVPVNPVTYGLLVDKTDTSAYDNLSAGAVGTLTLWDGHYTQTFSANSFEHNLFSRSEDYGNYSYGGRRTTANTKGALKFDTPWLGGAHHTLALGAEYQDEEYRQAGPFMDPSWATGYSRTQTGLFSEYLLDLPFGLSLSAAARHDDFEAFKDADTWRLTASQKLATTTRLHTSVGTGVTAPTFVQQFGSIPGTFVGNPDLNPEKSTGWDIGVEQTLIEGRLTADVTYFWVNLTDEIVTKNLTGGLKTVVNSPTETSRQGVEVTLSADLLSWLSLEGTYTYTDADAYDTNYLAVMEAQRVPQSAASGRATVKFADGRGRATVAVMYNSSTIDTYWGLATERVTLDPYTVVNGLISYDLTPNTTIYLRGNNLFDEKYEEVFSYVAPGRWSMPA
ncbi:MAG: TonB-dependent receptor [Methylacidiphilales bacterium]|nr:TonB-dependent receptor [Candidatus Methylacidiphilales bacterium]